MRYLVFALWCYSDLVFCIGLIVLFFSFIANLISSFHHGTWGFGRKCIVRPIVFSTTKIVVLVKVFTICSAEYFSRFWRGINSFSRRDVNRDQFSFFKSHLWSLESVFEFVLFLFTISMLVSMWSLLCIIVKICHISIFGSARFDIVRSIANNLPFDGFRRVCSLLFNSIKLSFSNICSTYLPFIVLCRFFFWAS